MQEDAQLFDKELELYDLMSMIYDKIVFVTARLIGIGVLMHWREWI